MRLKRFVRLLVNITFLDSILEFFYWGLVIVVLVELGPWLMHYPALLYLSSAAHIILSIAVYFFAVRRLKRLLQSEEG